MIGISSKIEKEKSRSSTSFPWRKTGDVQLSEFFFYHRDKSGGTITDMNGIEFGSVAFMEEEDMLKGWYITSYNFGGILFSEDFFKEQRLKGKLFFPAQNKTERKAVYKLFFKLITYLQKISKV